MSTNLDVAVSDCDKRFEQAEARTIQANARTQQANARTDQANARTKRAELQTDRAHLRTVAADVRTELAENREHAMRASELSYRRLFEAAREGILILNADTGRISDVNPFLVELLGFSHDEMVGKTVGELSPAKDLVSNQVMLDRLKKDGYVRHDDLPLQTKDGRHIAVEFVSNVYQAGVIKVIQCDIRDITARKVCDLTFALDQHAIVATTDAQGKITYVNDKFCAISKYACEELIGQDHRMINSSHHPREFIRDLWKTISSGRKWQGEIKNQAKDGSFYWVDTTIVPFLNEHGMPRQYVAIRTDITERKRTEEALRESEARFRFLHSVAEATRALADTEQIMALMVRMLCEHLGASRCAYASVEGDGEQFTILQDYTDDCASTVGNYRLSLFGAQAQVTLLSGQTLIIRDVDAELSPGEGADMFSAIGIKAIITCPLIKDGRLLALMAVHQTVPRNWESGEIAVVQEVVERCWATIERRHAEEKVHQLNAELERRVIERTAELQAANEELEAFSYSVSHDLRAPLRAINGFAGIVMKEFAPQMPAAAQPYLERICNGGKQMGVLIDNLLAFSQLGRQPLQRQQVDMAKLVQSVLSDLSPKQESRQIQIRTTTLPHCWGDPALLRQVWVNLISNAIKYTVGRESALIEIGCACDKGEEVYFVRDNGTGFDMKYAHKLFGVFQRLHLAEKFEGTGVGLAIVQRIVNRHNGRVWAEAEQDRGATFRFTLGAEQ